MRDASTSYSHIVTSSSDGSVPDHGTPNDWDMRIYENRLATYREAAGYLRYSEVYLRRLVKEGKIPYIKRGRSIRFRIAALDKWNLESEVSIGTAKAKR